MSWRLQGVIIAVSFVTTDSPGPLYGLGFYIFIPAFSRTS